MSSCDVSLFNSNMLSQLEYRSARAAKVFPEMLKKSQTTDWNGYCGVEGGCGGMAGLLGAVILHVEQEDLDLIKSSL